MGKNANINKETLVTYDKNTNISTCILCKKTLKGNILGNIKRHYKTLHNYTFEEGNSTIIKQQNNARGKIKITKSEFIKCCVGLVTVKNVPFRIFDDETYFKKIIKIYEEQFNVTLNSKNIINEHIKFESEIKKKKITRTLENKMISIKMDVATRSGKSILGINVQCIENYKIEIYTIGMIQLNRRHTGHFLKEEILKCLKQYNIDLTKIYSTTTDNGANIIKASKLLKIDCQQDEMDTCSDEGDDDYEQLHERLNVVFEVVKCASHTLQLAAHDLFKEIHHKIEQTRKCVKILRTYLKHSAEKYRMPLLDNATRWNSTFNMIESLLTLKDHIYSSEIIPPPECDIDWTFTNNFVEAFSPVAECTKQLQTEQYIMGDFYRDWLVCEAKLKRMTCNAYANSLLKYMEKRKMKLMDNIAFLTALYFDPRFNFMDSPFFTEENKKNAVLHIIKTNVAINALNGDVTLSSPSNGHSDDINAPMSDPYAFLEEDINCLRNEVTTNTQSSSNLRQKLDSLAYGEKKPFGTNILNFWKEQSLKDPELCKIASVVLAVPSSQVSVERAFSALPTIITKQRTRLTAEHIHNILIVKLNEALLNDVEF